MPKLLRFLFILALSFALGISVITAIVMLLERELLIALGFAALAVWASFGVQWLAEPVGWTDKK